MNHGRYQGQKWLQAFYAMIWFEMQGTPPKNHSLVTEQDDSQQFFENQGFLWTFICHWHPGYDRATPKIWWWFQHVDHEKQSNHMGDAIRNRRVNIKELKTSAHLYRNLTYDLWRVFQDMQNSCNRIVKGTIIEKTTSVKYTPHTSYYDIFWKVPTWFHDSCKEIVQIRTVSRTNNAFHGKQTKDISTP